MIYLKKTRYLEIDFLKCVCILTVVYIHSISTSFSPGNFLGYLAGDITRFAVPGLFFASGFLFDKKKYTTKEILWKKFLRLIPPYLFCSICFQVIDAPGLTVARNDLNSCDFLKNIVFGNTFGIYYFVFVLFYLFALSIFFRRLSKKVVLLVWVFSFFVLFLFFKGLIARTESMFWFFRHPFIYLFYYLSGWIFSLYYHSIVSCLKKYYYKIIICGFGIITTLLFYTRICGNDFYDFPVVSQFFIILSVFVIVGLGVPRRKSASPKIVFLSKNSYGIYLLHFPIVRYCQFMYPEASSNYSIYSIVFWSLGLSVSVLLILAIKRIAGKRSIYLIGS
jgi:peptidoglycan/LPS O-acetylase OafA/YrhL